MKKFVIVFIVAAIMPMAGNAQDDMYFSPKETKSETFVKKTPAFEAPHDYSCHRDVDEYNRRGIKSYYQTLGNDSTDDVIDFNGTMPDSLYSQNNKCKMHRFDDAYDDDDDYVYSRRMRYFDDFWWYNDPWYWGYTSYYYGPSYAWYGYGWRPWCYGYYSGWYDPWYYDYGYWHRPNYGGGYIAHNPANRSGVTGTSNHGWVGRGNNGGGVRNAYRGSNSTGSRNTDAYNRRNSSNTIDYSRYRNSDNQRVHMDAYSRSNRDMNTSTFRNNTFDNGGSFNRGSYNSGGGFSGGNHGGGFSNGGSTRSGGGGHFGGRR